MLSHLLLVSALCATFTLINCQRLFPAPLLEAPENESVTFTCESTIPGEGVNNILQIFDPSQGAQGAFVPFDSARVRRVIDGSFANYTFGPLNSTDNGTVFICSSTGMSSNNATVSVLFPPMITRQNPDPQVNPVVIREGQALTIDLEVLANPQPMYNWTRNGELIGTDINVTVVLDSLVFNPVLRKHIGQYILTTVNSAGSNSYSFQMDVQYPPEFRAALVSPNTVNYVIEDDGRILVASIVGKSVTFLCDFDGNPTPMLQRDVVEQTNVMQPGNSIVINSIATNHAGTYVCTISSSTFPQETVTRTFRLFVGGTALPVSDVQVDIRTNSVVVSWMYDNAVNSVPARFFHVSVTQDGTQVIALRIRANETSYTIPGNSLIGGQTYMVSVVVSNLQGNSTAIMDSILLPTNFNGSIRMTALCLLSLISLATMIIFMS